MLRTLVTKTLRPIWTSLSPARKDKMLDTMITFMPDVERFRIGMPTAAGMFKNMRDNGFAPATILDAGANIGEWSRMAHRLFPSANITMFDGNLENEIALRGIVNELGNGTQYHISLLGPEEKEAVTFYKLGTGSSVLPELTAFDKEAVTLPMHTLDGILGAQEHPSPLLLKLDVQGFELEVLRGATQTLQRAEVVLMEVALLPFNTGAPLFAEVVAFMEERGFAVFDFCGQARRESDEALFQTDIAFVRHDSNLRAPRKFFHSEK